jgi:hypothetical protein
MVSTFVGYNIVYMQNFFPEFSETRKYIDFFLKMGLVSMYTKSLPLSSILVYRGFKSINTCNAFRYILKIVITNIHAMWCVYKLILVCI